MADPKYASLPGIDLNSPDVFETSDLPEDEQALQQELTDAESESVEKLVLDTGAAYGRFRGKNVDSKGIDFSDKLSEERRTGYEIKSEYELLGEGMGKMETPQQKYVRLQHEIRELAEELNKIKENVKDEVTSEKLSPVVTGKQLEYLQHQLTDLHLEKLLGPEASVDLSDPQGALHKRLMTQLESFKPSPKSKASATEESPSDHVTYELYYKPEQAQFSKNAKLANLEERLDRIEAAIGNCGRDKLGQITADTDHKSLVGSVSVLNSKLSLLEPANLEQVEARLNTVLHKMNQIAEKKTGQEDPDKQSKISELYEMVKKWEAIADSVPHVVDRLAALRELHEQALQFSQALTYLDTTQQEINNSLNSHGDMLKQLQETFTQNTDSLKMNCESLDTRIKTLKK
ncbi:hypothetical protein CHS0354_012206 [Potamilus streckersoni]|uniref:Dynactin subunit 2 n=1 Tax=Potamilus streckersoni TaxID=2493646 RepID=A0AAE0VRP9_9BIVA|nr:hypothetical protein CHS0354_012206 [Potamilus streckersoni]